MQITVFGANGKVGSRVVEKLLAKGHHVVAFVYKAQNMPSHPGLTVVQGDIHNPTAVSGALEGSEAVVSALGSWGTSSKDILTAGMQSIVPAMKAQKITRIISLTGADAWDSTDAPSLFRRLNHTVLGLIAPRILRDGEQHIAVLRGSGLDWTVLRSPVMKETGKAGYTIRTTSPKPWHTIIRDDVAEGMVQLLEDSSYPQQSPYITSK